ncbi:hypothetical protein RGQ29_003578 [Quercus rubra]|uniref:pectinesterase n=1 Tax=Quercus rubra TaxID=3512 RepID=A0AAN7I7T7_QUERU|nr:hypothetical protein RGQ29_003578 [Quercus rubra]
MQLLISSFYFTLSLFVFLIVSKAQTNITKTIIVDQSGKGNFIHVQQSIDSIPPNNQEWTIIHLKSGVYNEKVEISAEDKPYIILQGENRVMTVIQWGDFGRSLESSTFKLLADNFMAREITFKAFVQGDKVSFYGCSFISLQVRDTLTDWEGRHYFEQCYFEGVIDFIWGGGQSIYQSHLADGNAYITAQARKSDKETNGFVFKYCKSIWKYSRVLFYKSVFADIIAPQGWDAWNHEGKEETITYAEIGCIGPGADMSKRVKWEKNLSEEEVRQIVRVRLFINQEMWLQEQLHALTISGPHMLLEK